MKEDSERIKAETDKVENRCASRATTTTPSPLSIILGKYGSGRSFSPTPPADPVVARDHATSLANGKSHPTHAPIEEVQLVELSDGSLPKNLGALVEDGMGVRFWSSKINAFAILVRSTREHDLLRKKFADAGIFTLAELSLLTACRVPDEMLKQFYETKRILGSQITSLSHGDGQATDELF